MNNLALLTALTRATEAFLTVLREELVLATPIQASDETVKIGAVEAARRLHPDLGPRQAEIIELLERTGAEGTTHGAIAKELGRELPNTHTNLQVLVQRGLLERDDSLSPIRYRLAPRIAEVS